MREKLARASHFPLGGVGGKERKKEKIRVKGRVRVRVRVRVRAGG